MNKKTIITYIKNGKEKTLKLNKLNEKFILNKIFYHYNDNNKEYKVRDEISYLEIKNKEFKGNTTFYCFKTKKIIVLDNCKIDGLTLEGCSYHIINPIFYENSGSIKGNELEELIIDISPMHNQYIYLNIEIAENFTLNGNNNYQGHLTLKNIENILINNVKMDPRENTSSLYVRNSNLKINNSDITCSFIKGHYLELINTNINSRQDLFVSYKKLKEKISLLKRMDKQSC